MTDRDVARRVLGALRDSPVGDTAVLVGSSGLFGFDTDVPALTEDVDVCVPESIVAHHGDAIIEALRRQGFAHEHGTATFVSEDGVVFDLLGHGDPRAGDHIGGAGGLRVMVFEDLSRIVGEANATMGVPGGGRALTPAGFVASKLLTERAHKGSKDKIQALLLLAERRGEAAFVSALAALLAGTAPIRLEDASASAQDALLALERDPTFTDAGAEGYGSVRAQVAEGLGLLHALLERMEAERG